MYSEQVEAGRQLIFELKVRDSSDVTTEQCVVEVCNIECDEMKVDGDYTIGQPVRRVQVSTASNHRSSNTGLQNGNKPLNLCMCVSDQEQINVYSLTLLYISQSRA